MLNPIAPLPIYAPDVLVSIPLRRHPTLCSMFRVAEPPAVFPCPNSPPLATADPGGIVLAGQPFPPEPGGNNARPVSGREAGRKVASRLALRQRGRRQAWGPRVLLPISETVVATRTTATPRA